MGAPGKDGIFRSRPTGECAFPPLRQKQKRRKDGAPADSGFPMSQNREMRHSFRAELLGGGVGEGEVEGGSLADVAAGPDFAAVTGDDSVGCRKSYAGT